MILLLCYKLIEIGIKDLVIRLDHIDLGGNMVEEINLLIGKKENGVLKNF